ncbi:HdeD family acid-resistance protein [uncultured Shimia sp.]|uniref:HdeD family acid-resistance protein n=1 Tax=uncultured Shimia sp. TaxID=573152 RepID=UPI00260E0168|nr:HdeD family acid-resistance protein [uncultured Shimia sp.]
MANTKPNFQKREKQMGNTTSKVQNNWGWFLALGILMIIGGSTAFFAPFMVSLVVEVIVGVFFVVAGITMLVQVFTTDDGWDARITYLILGVFNTFAGLMLLFRPLEGLMALTLVMITAFFVNGLLRIAVGVMARPEAGSGWVIFGGAISVLASIYLVTVYPEVSVTLLGIVAGVSLVSEGAGYVRFAFGLKNGVSVAV